MRRLQGAIRTLTVLFLLLALIHFFSPHLWRLYYPLKYEEAIIIHSRRNNLDPSLTAAVIRVESSFNPDASSGRGAKGLMQLMPETSAWIAEQMQVEYAPEMLRKPEYNISLGCWYLNNLMQEFDSLVVSLAAYNAGRGRVKGWLDNDQWDGSWEDVDDIPYGETRQFIRRVFNARRRYKDLYPDIWMSSP